VILSGSHVLDILKWTNSLAKMLNPLGDTFASFGMLTVSESQITLLTMLINPMKNACVLTAKTLEELAL
jgi:hypothetical protein